MKRIKLLSLFLLLAFASGLYAQSNNNNPLLIHSNNPISFDKVTAKIVREAVTLSIKSADAALKKISQPTTAPLTFDNVVKPFDAVIYDLTDLSFKLGLISSTYVDDSTRNAANDENERLGLYMSNINLNERLYKTIKAFSLLPATKNLPISQKKFLDETILSFEKNGMKLPAIERKKLEKLNAQLINYSTQFDKNIAEYKDSAVFILEELLGVEENKLNEWKRGEDRYVVNINGPNYTEIMTNASNPATRRTAMLKYNDRAYPKNIKVLDSMLYYRNVLAKTLGFKSYAAFSVADKMSETPANVWSFINDLKTKLAPGLEKELNELKALKAAMNPELKDGFNLWDVSYYQKKLLDKKYQLNTDQVKEYFEMNNTIAGMFEVYKQLFGIQIKEIQGLPVWHQ